MTNQRAWTSIGLVTLAMFAAGCGSDTPEMATVKGSVVLNGEQVPGGRVMFSPLAMGETTSAAGRSAVGLVDEFGYFELMTYAPGDGVVVGKHSVLYYQPEGDDEEERAEIDVFFTGKKLFVPADAQQEIVAGTNQIEVEVFDKAAKQ